MGEKMKDVDVEIVKMDAAAIQTVLIHLVRTYLRVLLTSAEDPSLLFCPCSLISPPSNFPLPPHCQVQQHW